MLVAGIEQVRVPAGSFEAVKVEGYGFRTGQLREEYWYSPLVKFFAKTRLYTNEEGIIEERLVSYRAG